MNRFKVNVAKEKIFRLQEKYSKSTNHEEENSSSESLISIKSEKRNDQEKENPFQQQISIFKEPARPNTSAMVFNSTKEDLLDEGTVEHEIVKADLEINDKLSADKLVVSEQRVYEKPLSPGSLVLSDLSNQFQRIRFISSSSEDMSTVESENSQAKSITSNKTSLVEIAVKSENTSNGESSDHKIRESETFNNINDNPSLKSLSELESNDSTKISSIKKLISSESLTKNNSHDTSFMVSEREHDDASVDDKVYHTTSSQKSNKTTGSSKNLSLKHSSDNESSDAAPSKVREVSSKSDVDDFVPCKQYKHYKQLNHKIKCERRNLSLEDRVKISPNKAFNNQSATNMYGNVINQSTNTDPVKVKSLNIRSKNHQRSPMCKVKRSTGKYKFFESSQQGTKQVLQKNQVTTRPFIKPCNLINLEEVKNMEAKCKMNQESQSFKCHLIDDFISQPLSIPTSGISSCDEVVSLLLRNQIQLTRHFMESHQRMYLQVCHAAKLLNEN